MSRTRIRHYSIARASFQAAAVFALWAPAARAEGPPAPEAPAAGPVLNLANGGYAPGTLLDSDQPDTLRWQAAPFVSPFEFDLKAVNNVHFPSPKETPRPAGNYAFELAGGDVVYGALVGLDDAHARLDIPNTGVVKVAREKLVRIDRWRDGADLVYIGPNGLSGWAKPAEAKPAAVRGFQNVIRRNRANMPKAPEPAKPADTTNPWREESGHLVTDRPGVALHGDFKIPVTAAIELEISWKTKPDFILALGTDGSPETVQRAFRLEVWENELVAFRETDREADLASLQAIAPGPGRAQLRVYLDQENGRLLVFSGAGPQAKLADLTVSLPIPRLMTGITLANQGGDVRLERLRIGRWDGAAPREVQPGKSRIHQADGSIVYGQVSKYDPDAKEFVVREGDGKDETRVPEAKIASLFLSPAVDDPSRTVRATYQDGSRLSGRLVKVEKETLLIAVPGVEEPTRLPLAGLRSVVALKTDLDKKVKADATKIPDRASGVGVLEMDGLKLPGKLSDATEQPGSSCLAWQPLGSKIASPLRPDVSGRVVYREAKPVVASNLNNHNIAGLHIARRRAAQPAPAQLARAFLGAAFGDDGTPTSPQSGAGERRALYLRSGDIIPSTVTKIDETGVWFKTPLSDSKFVAHDKVKAVELSKGGTPSVKIAKAKRDRLLTLPRMQRDSPPTQLIRSLNGDYLRGRVIGMDDKTLQVETRLETKELPRNRVARVIWLHADELDAKKAVAPPAHPGTTRVQALRSDGIRLTFHADRRANDALSGKSDVLGVCRVGLGEVDQILFGKAIDQAAAGLAFQQWKLQNAVDPKIAQADGGQSAGGGPTGTDAAMVGKPAPDFKLDLLGGKPFKLSETKGKVVVLDFWATWCGPCLQAMPQVDKVTREFKDQGVTLIAVNLQEAPKQISSMLERHKLDMTVALDIDGAVAQKYGANAIPQTVIIDREGNVARLFVGGGPHFDDTLREALKAVVAGVKPPESAAVKE